MIDHDKLFKQLISTFFLEFLELFCPEVLDYIEGGGFDLLDKEIFTDVTAGERREVDVVVKLRFKGEDTFFLVHVENQAQPQAHFGERMFSYFARLHAKHRLPVYPIAVLTYDLPLTEQPDLYRVQFPDRLILDFHYRVIQLNRLNWRDFVRKSNPVASALMAKMKIAPEDRPRVKLECIRLLTSLTLDSARMHMIAGFVDSYLRLDDEEEHAYQIELEKIAPAEKERIMDARMSWRERDLQEGLQQGMSSLVTHQIEHRFGPVDTATLDRIRGLDPDQLEILGDALLDFRGAEDLSKWLETH